MATPLQRFLAETTIKLVDRYSANYLGKPLSQCVNDAFSEAVDIGTKAIKDAFKDSSWNNSYAPPTKPSAKRAAELVKVEEMVKALDDRIPQYISCLENAVTIAVRTASTPELLQMNVYTIMTQSSGFRLFAPTKTFAYSRRPQFKKGTGDWAVLFVKYLTKKAPENTELHAGLEQIIEDAVKKATETYFSSPEVCEILRKGIAKQVDNNAAVQGIIKQEMKKTGKWAQKEIKDTITLHGKTVAADRIHDTLSHAGHVVGSTAVGHMLLTALSAPVVKLALVKAAGTALGIEAVRAIVMKFGVATLFACFLGSAAASTILMWAALPIIAGVIVVQWVTLPDTLAKKLPGEVVKELRKQAPETNRAVVKSFVASAFETLLERIHESAMEGEDS
jgi:hypothetical protein